MTVDLKSLQTQLLGTFFDESFEGLERLETGLLKLEEGFDAGTVNDIFRAAHSIKGAAGTFGFGAVTEFAHDLETLLDAVRNGIKQPTGDVTAMMLESVDFLRKVMETLRDGGEPPMEVGAPLRVRLQDAVKGPSDKAAGGFAAPASVPAAAPTGATQAVADAEGWTISFRPRPQLLTLGNEPWRLVRELETMGTLSVTCDTSRLPPLGDIVPTTCYLAWTFHLVGSVSRAAIEDVFSWVMDECELSIEPTAPAAAAAPVSASPVAAAPVAAVRATRDEPDAALASLRVGIDKIDSLMNMVGELVITQSMLGELDDDEPIDQRRWGQIREGLAQLARNSRALQESVMRLRSMPISVVFNRFPRLVHDLSKQFGKRIQLVVTGQGTELDKTVLEKLGDPLVHLVRNSLDHGLEGPEERAAAGKPETGTLTLAAFHSGGDIVIEVRDDGRGLNPQRILAKARERGLIGPEQALSDAEITNLIFAPGFSTAQTVTDVSGRGVGMDVVKRNVQALGGSITVDSTFGVGTRITLRLPLTLAIIDGQLIRIADRPYVVPLLSIVESVQIEARLVKRLNPRQEVYRLRDHLIPIIDLATLLGAGRDTDAITSRASLPGNHGTGLLVIVECDGQRLGLLVDELQGQQQVVVKSLEANFGRVPGLSGATILGSGSVAFILDVAGLAGLAKASASRATGGAAATDAHGWA